MRSGVILCCAATLLVAAACGSEDDDPNLQGTGGYAGGGAVPGAGSVPPGNGGTPGSGGLPGGGAPPIGTGGVPGGGVPNAGGGPGAGGGPDPGNGGFPGSGGASPGGSTGSGGGGPVGGPKIPEPTGECPALRSGTQTILGLSTTIQAGAAGSGKGPLLFVWHGTGGNGAQGIAQVPASVKNEITAAGGMIVAASDNNTVREGQDVTAILAVWYDVGDIKWADQITACAVKNHNIDPNRIYVTGCSAGGLMTGTMAFRRSSYVAAAVPNSGGGGGGLTDNPARIPPVMCMHGGAGDNVVINFGDSSHALENLVKAKSLAVDCEHSSGHCGAPSALYQAGWQFMKDHPFDVGTSPYKSGGLPSTFPQYCKIVP